VNPFHRRCVLAHFLFLLLPASALAAESSFSVSPATLEAVQGTIVTVRVSGPELEGVRALHKGVTVPFFPAGPPGTYEALLGVDLEEKPGSLKVLIKTPGHEINPKAVPLRVKKGAFPTERLSVSEAFDRFDKPTLARISREQARMNRLWPRLGDRRLWKGPFVAPVPGGKTSAFGRRRVVNGTPRSPHTGVDLRAPLGAPVIAANDGKVVLRDEFFFNGKSIVLDHGWGLYTMYFHLSEFRVEEGARVRKGQVIGLAGMTGRVTGPHLHWGARLNQARIDPFQLLEKVRAD